MFDISTGLIINRNIERYFGIQSCVRVRSPYRYTKGENSLGWYYGLMKKILPMLLVVLVLVGCYETSDVIDITATDVPLFADGRAIVLTIEAICDGLSYDLTTQEGTSLPLSEFTEEYQGHGVWLVQLAVKKDYKWNVYESTGTVTTAGTYETYMKYGTSRTATRHIC